MAIQMHTRFVIISLGLFCLILGHQQGQIWAAIEDDDVLDVQAIIKPLYEFTCELFQDMTYQSRNGSVNVILSPISIHKALNLVLLGMDEKSEAREDLIKALGYSGMSEAELQMCHMDYKELIAKFKRVAERALAREKPKRREGESESEYIRRIGRAPIPPVLDLFNMVITKNKGELLPEYKRKVKRFYESTMETVDDKKPETKRQVIKHLNGWAKEAGFGSPILSEAELNKRFEAILLSAIRVQASWVVRFHERKDEAIFYNHGLEDKPVNGTILIQEDIRGAKYLNLNDIDLHDLWSKSNGHKSQRRGYFGRINAHVVQVPLDGGLSFTIFEPLEYSTYKDKKLERMTRTLFFSRPLTKILDLLDEERNSVRKLSLTMPKFKFEKEYNLEEILNKMDLRSLMHGPNTGISSMTTKKDLVIDKAMHQAMIDVNERGIKAAAVTKMTMVYLSANSPSSMTVEIKRPFVFLIRYGKVPLFVGQLQEL